MSLKVIISLYFHIGLRSFHTLTLYCQIHFPSSHILIATSQRKINWSKVWSHVKKQKKHKKHIVTLWCQGPTFISLLGAVVVLRGLRLHIWMLLVNLWLSHCSKQWAILLSCMGLQCWRKILCFHRREEEKTYRELAGSSSKTNGCLFVHLVEM